MRREPLRYFVPGPAFVGEAAREALRRPIVPHRSADFVDLYRGLQPRLEKVFRSAVDIPIATGSSTLLMEASLISTVHTGVLNLTCGAFSERWHEIARALGKSADRVSVPWGEAVDPDLVRRALRRKRYDAVTLVHNETSTGVMSPLAEIASVVREESDALLLVDAVSSLAGAPVETDEWKIDLVLAGSQKALALPPGLTLFSLSERLAEQAAKVPRRGFYTDLLRYRARHRSGGTITTPAIPLFYALDCQLDRILEEGIETRWERHRRLADQTARWASAAGFEYASAEGARSWTVSCLRLAGRTPAAALVEGLARRGFVIAAGYGSWRDSTFRIGHMGEVESGDLKELLTAIDDCMIELRG
jgi:aspartate aminotransferase-like enzyme